MALVSMCPGLPVSQLTIFKPSKLDTGTLGHVDTGLLFDYCFSIIGNYFQIPLSRNRVLKLKSIR